MPAPRSAGDVTRSPESDLRLVREALDGRTAAVEQLLDRLACVPTFLQVRNARFGRPLDRDELEDLAQDTLILLWRDLREYAGRAALETWAYSYCSFQFQRRVRDLGRRRDNEASVADVPDRSALPSTSSPADSVDGERMDALLQRLDPVDALIVRMRCYDDCAFDDIAARLELSVSAVKSRYYRGLERLSELLCGFREPR
ncbi:MAG: RNA polymerase sigma factor [Planctomycetota bacterium]|nr:MAG: RNA polymerase sigma factor [Planctomycetota bacterium]